MDDWELSGFLRKIKDTSQEALKKGKRDMKKRILAMISRQIPKYRRAGLKDGAEVVEALEALRDKVLQIKVN